MRRLAFFTSLVLAAALADTAGASDCPKGATVQGAPPTRGEAYFCAKPGPAGEPVRHGWSVQYDDLTANKRAECEFRDGQLHGRCTRYDADGQRTERGFYDQGQRTREWWFWSLPTADPTVRTRVSATADPTQLVQRRAVTQELLAELGASPAEAQALTQHLLGYVDDPAAERALKCGEHLCVGPGRGGEPVYVHLEAAAEASERDRAALADLLQRAQLAVAAEQKLLVAAEREAAAAEKRRLKEYRAAVERYKKLSRQWNYTSLRCNDGQRSPTCTCGGSWQGCCSWHGGVDGCPREEPTPPDPPPGVADALSEY